MVKDKVPDLAYDDGVIDGMNKLQEWYNEGKHVGYNRGVAEGYAKGKEDMLAEKLSKRRPNDIIRDAQADRSTGATKYAVQILRVYNYGLREEQRLPNVLQDGDRAKGVPAGAIRQNPNCIPKRA